MPMLLIDDEGVVQRLRAYVESSGKPPAAALDDLLSPNGVSDNGVSKDGVLDNGVRDKRVRADDASADSDPFAFARTDERGTDRLEAFCDGVFATAGTLLIFSITVPEVSEPGAAALIAALTEQLPYYVGLLISFVLIGATWMHHHHMFRYIQKNSHTLMLLNVLMMLTVVVIPFTASLLTTFIAEPEQGQVGAVLYAGAWFAGAIFWNLMWRHAIHAELLDPAMPPAAVKSVSREFLGGPLLYGLSLVTSFFNLPLAVILFVLPGLYYLLPPNFFRNLGRRMRGERQIG